MEAQRKKIGLALGSGAAKGFAHLGVIEALEEYGIAIDMIAGTSIGAIFGGWYAATRDIDHIKKNLQKTDWRSLISWKDISPRRAGAIFNTMRLECFLRGVLGNIAIESLQMPFAAVATDVKTGEAVHLARGDLVRAMLASIAVPVLFPPVEQDSRLLIDGGVVEPVPFRAVRQLGAEIVIGVDLYISANVEEFGQKTLRPWQLFNILSNSLAIMEHQLVETQRSPEDILLRPRVSHIHPADFSRFEEGWRAGREEARAMKKVIFDKTGAEEKPKTLGEKFREFMFEE